MGSITISARKEILMRLDHLNMWYVQYREAPTLGEKDGPQKKFNEALHWFVQRGVNLSHLLPDDTWTLQEPMPTEEEIQERFATLKSQFLATDAEGRKAFDNAYDWLKKYHIEYIYDKTSQSFKQV